MTPTPTSRDESLFETLRIYAGRPFGWERHVERLARSAAELGFPELPSAVTLRAEVDQRIAAEGRPEAVLRLVVSRDSTGGAESRAGCRIEIEPIEARLWAGTRQGAARVIVSRTPIEPDASGRHKTTGRLPYRAAREEARAQGADEALLVSTAGDVLEGSVSNVFALIDTVLVTPPLAGILPGTTRAWVIEAAADLGLRVVERPIAIDELRAATEIALTNAVQEVVPVGVFEGRGVQERATGDLLRDAYRERVVAALHILS